MFKFNFEEGDKDVTATKDPSLPRRTGAAYEVEHDATLVFSGEVEEIDLSESVVVKKVRLSSEQTAEALGKASLNVSDLIPGEYEGGFKLWEGAFDLCHFLLQASKEGEICLERCRFLELGCGHGLPGILALLLNARSVHFQDFNAEVLRMQTMMNVQMALADRVGALNDTENVQGTVRYFSGEFREVAALCKDLGLEYDCILASEILYNTESYSSLLDCISTCLDPNGVAYIATKAYYFGVGGGSVAFEDHIRRDGTFKLETVWRNKDASNGLRYVIKLTYVGDP